MRFDKGALALCLFAPLVSADFTWWADGSCDGKISGEIDSMMEETIDMAKMIWDRMMVAEPNNLHPDRVYKTVFQEEPPIDPDVEEDIDKANRWERFAGSFPLRKHVYLPLPYSSLYRNEWRLSYVSWDCRVFKRGSDGRGWS